MVRTSSGRVVRPVASFQASTAPVAKKRKGDRRKAGGTTLVKGSQKGMRKTRTTKRPPPRAAAAAAAPRGTATARARQRAMDASYPDYGYADLAAAQRSAAWFPSVDAPPAHACPCSRGW